MKKSKRSAVSGNYHQSMNTGLTAAERAAQAIAAAEERRHTGGLDLSPLSLSEPDGMSPEDRAKSRGADYLQGLKSSRNPNNGYRSLDYPERREINRDKKEAGVSTRAAGFDQSADRTDYQMLNSQRGSDPTAERKSGSLFGIEQKS